MRTETHTSNFWYKNFLQLLLHTNKPPIVNQFKKDLDEGKEICFDLLRNSRGKTINSGQTKNQINRAKQSKHAAKENELTPEQQQQQQQQQPQQQQNRPQNKPGKLIGKWLGKFKASLSWARKKSVTILLYRTRCLIP